MTEQNSKAFEPGIYVKGDRTRRAESRADAVALVWDGFVRKSEEGDADNPSDDFTDPVPSGPEPSVEHSDTPAI